MKEITNKVGDSPFGVRRIFTFFKTGERRFSTYFTTGEYPTNKTRLDIWAKNFHPHLSDFRKLLREFEAYKLTSILKIVYKQCCSNDMIAMYEMFG